MMRTAHGFAALCLFLTTALQLAACSAPSDEIKNRMEEPTADSNYPPAPYGYIQGSTIANYRFLGKTPSAGDYDSLPMRDLLLGEFHADPTVKLVLIEGSAGWCYYCNEEAPLVENASTAYEARGFRALTILAEGSQRGAPAVSDDVTSWVSKHDFKKTAMAIDPEARLFQYAPASAFPVHILVDSSTMKIQWVCVGGLGSCDMESAVTDALGAL